MLTVLFCSIGTSVSIGQAPKPAPAAAVQPQTTTAAGAASVSTPAVEIPVVVRDRKGGPVKTLSKDSLVLQIDGHAQTIQSLTSNADRPVTFGILLDVGASQRDAIDEERAASVAFVDQLLSQSPGGNKAFVVQFAKQIDLLQDTTDSKAKLQAALKQVEVAPSAQDQDDADVSGVTPVPPSGSPRGTAPGTPPGTSPGTAQRSPRGSAKSLYDAIFLSADEVIGKQPGRRVLVVVSDGVDRNGKESLTEAIEAAQRANTIVYAAYVKGRQPVSRDNRNPGAGPGGGYPGGGYPGGGYPGGGYPGGGYPGGGYPGGGYPGGGYPGRNPQGSQVPSGNRVDGRKILDQIANETGGRMFEVDRKDTLDTIYTAITEELQAQYRLSFTPDGSAAKTALNTSTASTTSNTSNTSNMSNTSSNSDGQHQIDLTLVKGSSKDWMVQSPDNYYTAK